MSDVEALVEVLLRFDRPGPRYTSYPPANHFHAGVGPAEHGAALSRAARSEAPLTLYAHLPFCARRCAYCGCHSLLGRGPAGVDRYLDDLDAEAGLVAERLGGRRRLAQLQWGGGTPNYLSPDQLERCFELIVSRFPLADDAEVGVELDPCSLTREQLDRLRTLGFNRVSLGVQDLDGEVQGLIGRRQKPEQTRAAYDACRELGFPSIHFDLVYGLPGQSRESLATTLDAVVEMSPDRHSIFGFAYLPTLRENQKRLDPEAIPGAEERAWLYAESVARLTDAGYARIGMDHFARPDDELARAQAERRLHRNFQGYTTLAGPDLVALGLSGISDVAGCYAQNDKDLAGYGDRLAAGSLPTARGLVLSDEDLARRTAITELMCNLEVRFAEIEERHPGTAPFAEHFAEEIRRLDELEREGLLEVTDEAIRLVPDAWPLVRIAAMAFDAYLHADGDGPGVGSRYSRVV